MGGGVWGRGGGGTWRVGAGWWRWLPRTETGLLVVIVCAVGAVSTVMAGCWQSAKAVARAQTSPATLNCAGACATCTLS